MTELVVVSYNSSWPEMFEKEASLLEASVKSNFIAIHHVGSTSVPGLAAKPILDIILVTHNRHSAVAPLELLGYSNRGEFVIPFRLFFKKTQGNLVVNLHVYEEGNPEIELNLAFRDQLRAFSKDRMHYEDLKLALVGQPNSHIKEEGCPYPRYTLGKNAFIHEILKKTGFNKIYFHQCMHQKEWETARHFRQHYFFDKAFIEDPYTWTFDHTNHVHFVLYKGTVIVGYAHLQLWPSSRAALRIIVIDESFRGYGLGKYFLSLCEKWLKENQYKSLHTEASPEARSFYQKQGYTHMPFNDPDSYKSDPQDMPMGKVL